MLAECITKIEALITRSLEPKILKSGNPREQLVAHNGNLVSCPVKQPLGSLFYDLTSFIDAVLANTTPDKAEVYHHDHGAVCVIDKHDRLDRLALLLQPSDRWQTLQRLAQPAAMSQKQAIRLLRHDLAACNCDHILAALRKLDFHRRSDGARTIEHGRETLGRAVEAAVQGATDIPDGFTVEAPVWNTPGAAWPVTVLCTLDLDAEAEKVVITTLPDHLALGLALAQRRLHEALAAALDQYDVYNGTA